MNPGQRDQRQKRVVMQLGVKPEELATLMALSGFTARKLAKRAGWASHSYLNRLLSGTAVTVRAEPALRIAEALGVQVTDLFVPSTTTNPGRIDQHAKGA